LLPRQEKTGERAAAVISGKSVEEDGEGEDDEVEVSYGKIDSSKVTCREIKLRREERSRQRYPL
jgi:hypothetical protein